jgi:hypothetical protein
MSGSWQENFRNDGIGVVTFTCQLQKYDDAEEDYRTISMETDKCAMIQINTILSIISLLTTCTQIYFAYKMRGKLYNKTQIINYSLIFANILNLMAYSIFSMAAMIYMYYFGRQLLCLLVVYFLSRKAYVVYSVFIIKCVKISTIAMMILLTGNLLFSFFYPGNPNEPNCPGILSQNLIIVKIASTIIMIAFIATGTFIYRRVAGFVKRTELNTRSRYRATHFLTKLKLMIIVIFCSATVDLSFNLYHLSVQSTQVSPASCDLTDFTTEWLNTFFYEFYRLFTFFIPVISITYFFWVTKGENNKPASSNLLDSPELTHTPSANFFASLVYSHKKAENPGTLMRQNSSGSEDSPERTESHQSIVDPAKSHRTESVVSKQSLGNSRNS